MSEIIGILGKPRSGKTTYCAFKASQSWKRKCISEKLPHGLKRLYDRLFPHYDYFYCTDESIQHTITITYEELGMWKPPANSCIWLEEAGLGLDNRNKQQLPYHLKHLFAQYGHNDGRVDIYFSSQTADVDKVLRVRCHRLFMARPGRFQMTYLQRISYECGVDEQTRELADIYECATGIKKVLEYIIGRSKILWRPPYYKYFDSYIDTFKYPKTAPQWPDNAETQSSDESSD